MIYAAASYFGEAAVKSIESADEEESDYIGELIHTIGKDDSIPKKEIVVFWGDDWDLDLESENQEEKIIYWGDEPENHSRDGDETIIYWGGVIGDNKNINRDPTGDIIISSLDYMASALGEHGFYQSGYWGKKEDASIGNIYSVPKPDLKGYRFVMPVKGKLTSRYGYREKFKRVHKGVDIALSIGDTVRAALPGIIRKVSNNPGGYGKYIIMVHDNGLETRYGHLNDFLVKEGDKVAGGCPIALGGNTGNSTGPHLHFEARYRGYALDPNTLFPLNIKE